MSTIIECLERDRQSLQASIDAEKTAVERNRLGQFATPTGLAVEIASYVNSLLEEHEDIRFADPSVGSGSFYSAALKVFGSSRIKSAVGVEIDPRFASAARALWHGMGLDVITGDFTRIVLNGKRPPSPNLILANPPYVRHHHLSREDKQRLKEVASELAKVEVNGLAGLYVYFVLLATVWMEPRGIASWLIPSEFMDVNYGAVLRQFLTDRVSLIRIHRFSPANVQFDDALVSSAVVVFRNIPPPPGHEAEFTFGGTVTDPTSRESLKVERLRTVRKWTAYPVHSESNRLSPRDETGAKLSDLFQIRRGIATGDQKFFVMERTSARRHGIPSEYLRPMLPSPRYLKVTSVEADKDGYPILDPQLCVIDCDLPEHLIGDRYPSFWSYLQTADALGVKAGYLVGKRNPWYKQERREPAPFLCTYMGRGTADKTPFRFILNRSQAIASNLYLLLYPKGSMSSMLHRHPERLGEVHRLLSLITGHELRGEGRVYGGGLNKIEPAELGRVTAVPMVERWSELETLVQTSTVSTLFDPAFAG